MLNLRCADRGATVSWGALKRVQGRVWRGQRCVMADPRECRAVLGYFATVSLLYYDVPRSNVWRRLYKDPSILLLRPSTQVTEVTQLCFYMDPVPYARLDTEPHHFGSAPHISAFYAQVKQAELPSGSYIENHALTEWKENRESSCPILNVVLYKRSGAWVIFDKIDQNYIIGFYSPLKT